jgi:general secretion pathway protein G
MKNKKNTKGFTFIELMVVVIILGILAAIVLPKFTGRTEQARIKAAESQIQVFSTALEAYELDNGRYPTTEQGLQALVKKPTIPPIPNNWRGPYLQKKIPKDPWGNPYIYKCPGTHNPSSYDLYSYGPDGKEGGGDDITNW